MRIVDAQIHLWGSGLPSNMAHRQVTSFTTEEAVGLMDEGGVDAAVIHPPGWDPKATDMAFQARPGLSRPLRRPRRLPAEFAGQARARRDVAAPAGHARSALWISSRADAELDGRRDARLVVGRGR